MQESSKNLLHANFDWAVGLNRTGLRFMGIWPLDEDVRSRSFQTLLRVPFMITVMFLGLFLPQMYAFYLVINELPLAIDNLLTSCPAFTSCVKLFFTWQNTKVLRPVVQSILNDWFACSGAWEFQTMRRGASRARFVTIADYSVMALCYAGFVVAPLLGFNLRAINNITDHGERHLLVQSYYPRDCSGGAAFAAAYFFQLLGSFFVGLAVSVPDDYFGALVFHASAQYEILGNDITRFVAKSGEMAGRAGARDIDRGLGVFVERHVHLSAMVSAIEKAFSFVIAAQIFCMSVMVCCLGFQILGILNNTGDKPTPLQIITLIGTLFTMMIHTLVDCFASETLASRSAEVFYTIYKCKWYLLSHENVRSLLPMMIVSKKSRQIKAGKILDMSLATYCSIIKSTAGYISMLIAVSSK